MEKSTSIKSTEKSKNITLITVGDDFQRRLKQYNSELSQFRNNVILEITDDFNQVHNNLTLLECKRDSLDCIFRLEKVGIPTITLPWLDNDPSSNGILQTFHPWYVSEIICEYLHDPGLEALCTNINDTSQIVTQLKDRYPPSAYNTLAKTAAQRRCVPQS